MVSLGTVSLGAVSAGTVSLGTISLGLFFWLRHEGGRCRSDESSVPKEFADVYFNNVGPLVPSGYDCGLYGPPGCFWILN